MNKKQTAEDFIRSLRKSIQVVASLNAIKDDATIKQFTDMKSDAFTDEQREAISERIEQILIDLSDGGMDQGVEKVLDHLDSLDPDRHRGLSSSDALAATYGEAIDKLYKKG